MIRKNIPSAGLDGDLFEYVIAHNCMLNDIYAAVISDALKLSIIENPDVRTFITLFFDVYKKTGAIPSGIELRVMAGTDEAKHAVSAVLERIKTFDSGYGYDLLIQNTQKYIREGLIKEAVLQTAGILAANDIECDAGDIYKKFEDACNISLIDNLGFDYFNRIDDHIKSLQQTDTFISTGYDWFDKCLGGGWLESGRALYMFMGATNVGKSIVLGNIATRLLEKGKTVVVISLEMSETVYCKRISSQISGIPMATFRDDLAPLGDFLKKFKKGNPGARLFLKEFPPNSISAAHVNAYLKRLKTQMRVKPDVVIIDYLTLLCAKSPTGNMYEDGKSVAEEIRALSYPEFVGCPFISAGQINRSGFAETNPDLDKTGESMGIPQTADAIFSIWQTEQEKELGILNFGIRKNRFGLNSGKSSFRIDYDTLSISEAEDVFGGNASLVSGLGDALNTISKKPKQHKYER